MYPSKSSLEIIAGLIIVVGIIVAVVFWTAFLHNAPDLDLVTNMGTSMGKNASSTIDGTEGIAPYRSGISGTILRGPTCPVEYDADENDCSDKPYATLVAIYRASDSARAIVLTRSDEEGKFEVSLPPGEYLVGAGESTIPSCVPMEVTVLPEVYSGAEILCDTGIR